MESKFRDFMAMSGLGDASLAKLEGENVLNMAGFFVSQGGTF